MFSTLDPRPHFHTRQWISLKLTPSAPSKTLSLCDNRGSMLSKVAQTKLYVAFACSICLSRPNIGHSGQYKVQVEPWITY